MHRSVQSDVVRIRHAELLNAARERGAVARLKGARASAPHRFERLQTILDAAGHLRPPAAVTARALRPAV